MKELNKKVKLNGTVKGIDIESTLATYEGHTFFSIFFDRIQIYQQVLDILKEKQIEIDCQDGDETEHTLFRRLYYTL